MRPFRLGIALLGLGALSGCTPSCERVCDKLLSCNLETEGIVDTVCVDSCERQEALYNSWEDDTKLDAYNDHLRCLVRSECEEIVDGVCYDPEVFVVGSALEEDTAAQ